MRPQTNCVKQDSGKREGGGSLHLYQRGKNSRDKSEAETDTKKGKIKAWVKRIEIDGTRNFAKSGGRVAEKKGKIPHKENFPHPQRGPADPPGSFLRKKINNNNGGGECSNVGENRPALKGIFTGYMGGVEKGR